MNGALVQAAGMYMGGPAGAGFASQLPGGLSSGGGGSNASGADASGTFGGLNSNGFDVSYGDGGMSKAAQLGIVAAVVAAAFIVGMRWKRAS